MSTTLAAPGDESAATHPPADAQASPAAQPSPAARTSVGELASRLGEVTVLVAAILYALGAFSILGQLRKLELHHPSVLSGFAHEDIIMKGVGVLLTNVPNLFALVLLVTFAICAPARAWLHEVAPKGGGAPTGKRLLALAGYAVLAFYAVVLSTWWVGTLSIVATYTVVLIAWSRGRLLAPGALLAISGIGSLLLGATGTYLYPMPLPTVQVDIADETYPYPAPAGQSGEQQRPERMHGFLLGTGQEHEMYVVVWEDGANHVRIVGEGSRERVLLDNPTDDAGRVIDLLTD